MFDQLKEILRAKIYHPIITKHTAFFPIGQSVHEDGVTYFLLTISTCQLSVAMS